MSKRSIGLTWHGHSSFTLRSPQDTVVLVDPFFSGNPRASAGAAAVADAHIIALTHGHSDHVGDTLDIYIRLRPKVIGMFELILLLGERGLVPEDAIAMNIGGEVSVRNIGFAMAPAVHSSTYALPDTLAPAGLACGYVITFENGRRLYHAGDTWLMSEMEFIRRLWKPEIVLLPVGGRYTMDTRAARIALEMLSPEIFIPMHYDTFPEIAGSASEIARELGGCVPELIIPEIGTEISL